MMVDEDYVCSCGERVEQRDGGALVCATCGGFVRRLPPLGADVLTCPFCGSPAQKQDWRGYGWYECEIRVRIYRCGVCETAFATNEPGEAISLED